METVSWVLLGAWCPHLLLCPAVCHPRCFPLDHSSESSPICQHPGLRLPRPGGAPRLSGSGTEANLLTSCLCSDMATMKYVPSALLDLCHHLAPGWWWCHQISRDTEHAPWCPLTGADVIATKLRSALYEPRRTLTSRLLFPCNLWKTRTKSQLSKTSRVI